MKAVGVKKSLPVTDKNCFVEFEAEIVSPKGHDILVEVGAIAVNPVDYKRRLMSAVDKTLDAPAILGWDAVGVVKEVGEKVSLFKAGDEVFYAGDITRPGCNAEFQLVDERIVGKKPKSLNLEESASMPLTSLTAWEGLFDRMRISKEKDFGKSILIIGGAGGVGSIAIQLAKYVGLTVIATASREESINWCKELGADFVVDHRDLVSEVRKCNFKEVDYIFDLVDINSYWNAVVELIKPQGHITSITGSNEPLALNALKTKSASFSWELMYTRSMFQTEDQIEQHKILNQISELLDNKILRCTLKHTFHGLTAENLRLAHEMLESGKTIGKIAVRL
jgi:NADPH2:quinone reductase